jgi:hypothetical protein
MAKFVQQSGMFDGLIPEPKNTPTHDYTHNHDDTHTHTPKVRERKTSRLQILTYESLTKRMDEYAKLQGLSRAEVFEMAVNEFLERNT